MDQQQKKRVEWVQDKVITVGKITVIVKKLPFHRPKYSIEIGTMIEDRLMRFVNIGTSGQGKIQIESSLRDITTAVNLAEEHILSESQKAEDIQIAWKIEREKHSMNQGKQETPRTGKTERERQKKKQKLAS